MKAIYFIAVALAGVCTGINIILITFKFKKVGVIEIDQSEEKDRYLFLFTAPTEDIPKSKYVIFKTRNVTELVKKQKEKDALYYRSLMKGEENHE